MPAYFEQVHEMMRVLVCLGVGHHTRETLEGDICKFLVVGGGQQQFYQGLRLLQRNTKLYPCLKKKMLYIKFALNYKFSRGNDGYNEAFLDFT